MGEPVEGKQHLPCPKCDSSDAYCVYEGDDGSHYGKCYSCGYVHNIESGKLDDIESKQEDPKEDIEFPIGEKPNQSFRNISPKTLNHFGIEFIYNSKGNIVKQHYPYYDYNKNKTAVKTRLPGKAFSTVGSMKKSGLFGHQKFSKGGKFITIVEGELDACAIYETMGDYPVVALPGASYRLTQEDKDYLASFEHIVLCLDADKAGQEALEKLARTFTRKARVFTHAEGFKDACDYVKEGQSKILYDLWWKATKVPYKPPNLKMGSETFDLFNEGPPKAFCMYPYEGLNRMAYGIRSSELVMVAAGSGVGKTSFLKEVAYNVFNETDHNVGVIFFEEPLRFTIQSFASLYLEKNLILPDIEVSNSEKKEAWNQVLNNDRWVFWDHFGSVDTEFLFEQIRYMAVMLDTKIIFLDHISIVISGQENNDERRAIDKLMTDLAELCVELDISIIAVTHIKRVATGPTHEEGGQVKLGELRGSGAIAQLSHMALALERNQQAEDEKERNTTVVRVIKNRTFGITGPAARLRWNQETGRLLEIDEELEDELDD